MKAIFENRSKGKPNSVYTDYAHSLDFYAHWHPEIEVLYVIEGTIRVGINSEERLLSKNQMSICSSNDIHYYSSQNMRSESIILIFSNDIFKGSSVWTKYVAPASNFLDLNTLDNGGIHIKNALQIIMDESRNDKTLSKQFVDLNLSGLFLQIFRSFPKYYASSVKSTGNISRDKTPMQRALKYLENNFTEEINLESMADYAGLSKYHFSRLFKETTGINFNVYLSNLRIESAKRLIKNSSKKIIEIAYECGFSSIRTFNRNFKEFCDVTPYEYRGLE